MLESLDGNTHLTNLSMTNVRFTEDHAKVRITKWVQGTSLAFHQYSHQSTFLYRLPFTEYDNVLYVYLCMLTLVLTYYNTYLIQCLSDVLRTNTSLTVLNLESNRITRKGIAVSTYVIDLCIIQWNLSIRTPPN